MPPAPSKVCLIVAAGYGSIRVQSVRLDQGMSIISNETRGRRHRAFYPWKVTGSSFTMDIKHRNPEEFRAFNDWMRVYCEKISEPANTKVAPLRVLIPAIKFDRFCIPDGSQPFPFGRTFNELVRRQTLAFIGASDAIQASTAPLGRISAAYASTYHVAGGKAGEYLSNYAIASLSDAVSSGGADVFEDALYNPKVSPLDPADEALAARFR